MSLARQMESFFTELQNISNAQRAAAEGSGQDGNRPFSTELTQDEEPTDTGMVAPPQEEPEVVTRQGIGGE